MKSRNKLPFFVVKLRVLIGIAAFGLALVLLVWCCSGTGAYAVFWGKPIRRLPIYRVATEQKRVALTFDAAWGADKTADIVDIVQENGGRATFFLVGFWVDKFGDMVKKIDEAGFEIGTHSATHPHMSTLSREQMRSELTSSMGKIEAITGKKARLFRPPFGDYNNALIETAEELDLATIQWGTDSLDWKGLTAKELLDRVLPRVSPGDIILFHNNSDHIIEALPAICRTLVNKGYELVTVSDLIYHENCYIDADGVQHKQ